MAKTFYAVTRIKHGRRTEDGSQDGKYESVTFNPSDKVTDLSPDEMKELWRAGALTQTAPENTEEDEPDNQTPAVDSGTSSDKQGPSTPGGTKGGTKTPETPPK